MARLCGTPAPGDCKDRPCCEPNAGHRPGGALYWALVDHLGIPSRLRPLVRSVRLLPEPRGAEPRVYRRLPNGESEVIVRFGQGQATATLIGTRTRVLHKPASARAATLLVRFHAAGAYPFFGRPMAELTDQVVPVSELWDTAAWEAIETASSGATATRAVFDALLNALRRDTVYAPWSAPTVRKAVRHLLGAPSLPTVTELAERAGISQRHLRRGFADVVGLSPKRFLRILRFRRALAFARSTPEEDWAAAAEHAGYFDQAHLVHEFRALANATPTALVKA